MKPLKASGKLPQELSVAPTQQTLKPIQKLNPAFLAISKHRRRRFDQSIDATTRILEQQPLDRLAWFIKTRSLTDKMYIDDTDLEEEGIADVLLDENVMAKAPRPGTSLKARPGTQLNQSMRPMTNSGRPVTGFIRPSTQSRSISTASGGRMSTAARLEDAFRSGSRPGTSLGGGGRPMSVAGRFLRLGTQSMLASGGNGRFIIPEQSVHFRPSRAALESHSDHTHMCAHPGSM